MLRCVAMTSGLVDDVVERMMVVVCGGRGGASCVVMMSGTQLFAEV